MRVRILFFGPFRETVGADALEWSTGAGDMAALWRELVSHHPRLDELKSMLLMSRNLRLVKDSEGIAEGDEIAFFPMVSGG